MHGTRAVQKMIELLTLPEQITKTIEALSPNVVTLIKDINGNHQKQLVNEIIRNALTLVQDPYGNYVVQYVLELGDAKFSDQLIRQFIGHISELSVQKYSSNVIEKCIRVAEEDTRSHLIEEMINKPQLEKLLRDSYANYVVQTALDFANETQHQKLSEHIRPLLPLIRNTSYCKRIQETCIQPLYHSTPSSISNYSYNSIGVHPLMMSHQDIGTNSSNFTTNVSSLNFMNLNISSPQQQQQHYFS
ncbi:hypothetical protein CU098_004331, partial [Rhizopus stolonifer]